MPTLTDESTDLSTDLLNQLDFEIPCGRKGCDNLATWYLVADCICNQDVYYCDKCHEILLLWISEWLQVTKYIICDDCRTPMLPPILKIETKIK